MFGFFILSSFSVELRAALRSCECTELCSPQGFQRHSRLGQHSPAARAMPREFLALTGGKAPEEHNSGNFLSTSQRIFFVVVFLSFFERCNFKTAPTSTTRSMIKTAHDETYLVNCEIGGKFPSTVIVSLALCFLKAGRR